MHAAPMLRLVSAAVGPIPVATGGAAPAQTVTPLLPEAERNEMTLGLGLPIGGRGHVDVGYQHIWQADRRGRTIDVPRGPASASLNNGLYTATANLFAASLSWGF